MLIARYSLAKELDEPFYTPRLLKCGEDVKFEDDKFVFLDREISPDILYPPSIVQREIKIDNAIYLIPNINDLLKDTSKFVDYTMAIRKKYGFESIFYAPGVPPSLYPVLFYLGYDVFDNCYEYIKCGKLWKTSEDFCESKQGEIIYRLMIDAFRDLHLREFVEGIPDNKSQEILRHADFRYYRDFENFYPIHQNSMDATTLQSLYRPDVVRWRERIEKRYRRPKYGRYLLLLPCSARKPYSESRSHRILRKYIESTMHEVILTSPLGLVPRELERFYPAQNYDVPVVGRWYEEEKRIISEMLRKFLEQEKGYESIVSFLPKSMEFLHHVLREFGAIEIWGNDYESLRKETKRINYFVGWKERVRDDMESVFTFQFGINMEFKDLHVRGRYPQINVYRGDTRILGFDPHRGMLTLTEHSANYIASRGVYTVYIDDFFPVGNVFAAGVVDATKDVRIGDEVAIVHKDEVRAWGTARMTWYDMVRFRRGLAVKVRGKTER